MSDTGMKTFDPVDNTDKTSHLIPSLLRYTKDAYPIFSAVPEKAQVLWGELSKSVVHLHHGTLTV